LSIGGDEILRVNSTRVWRIVGYMRCALEPRLRATRWESRLAQRHALLKQRSEENLNCAIFDAHLTVLNLLNVAVVVGALFSIAMHTGVLRAPAPAL